MDRPGVLQVPEGSGEQGKMEKTGCKIIFGAPTTLAVKGLMMMMMMMISQSVLGLLIDLLRGQLVLCKAEKRLGVCWGMIVLYNM